MKRNFSLFAVLTIALVIGLAAYAAPNFAAPATVPQAGGPLPSATEAQQELRGYSAERVARIKDARVRTTLERAAAALQAVANNKSAEREAGLVREAQARMNEISSLPHPPTPGCLNDAINGHNSCQADCKKQGRRWCGCFIKAVAKFVDCAI